MHKCVLEVREHPKCDSDTANHLDEILDAFVDFFRSRTRIINCDEFTHHDSDARKEKASEH